MHSLRIVTQNIWNVNDHWQERADAIGQNMRELDVDIICIQESVPDHFEYLKSHSFRGFPHAYYAASDDGSQTPRPQGLAIFSRLAALEDGKVEIGREREMSNPWMRNLQYIRVKLPSDHSLAVFNTHLFISSTQKKTGIATCVEVMQREEFADCIHVLAGDFNIKLDTQPDYLAPLAEQQYADIWTAKNGDKTGYTAPHDLDHPLDERIDGHFTQRDQLDRVKRVKLVNTEPINDGRLLLSDHIGVMAELDFDGSTS
ncbi:MAG: endonuclease/exonuclease/phosphatase family protein [Chloroflexi bacterium]|nr:endonuclease/exonuclease/phosphatase family protein [Chloroflexota bacterium]